MTACVCLRVLGLSVKIEIWQRLLTVGFFQVVRATEKFRHENGEDYTQLTSSDINSDELAFS